MVEPKVDYYTELIQIVIYLADVKDKTKQNIGNRYYCEAIDRHFSNFKNHAAVTSTRELIQNKHFNYIRPHRAAVCFDELINGDGELTEWAKLIKEFEYETDFKGFFSGMLDYYCSILKSVKTCPINDWKKFIDNYFRSIADLNVIICPLDGNYGFVANGKAYVVRCQPYYNEDGQIPFVESSFAKGIAHEYAHCFVNSIVEKNKNILKDYASFFKQHKDMYSFYNVDYAVINEYWVRAFAIRFMEKMRFDDFDVNEEYVRQRKTFLFIDRFTESLKRYECSKDSFEVFYLSELSDLLH